MLKGDQFNRQVKQELSTSIQIRHMNKPAVSMYQSIDPIFLKEIENHQNPSSIYSKQMKSLHIDQLKSCLKEKSGEYRTGIQTKQNYISRLDKVLCETQINSLTNSLLIQKQKNSVHQFVDQNLVKAQKIDSFIKKNEDKDVFNHQNDIYQQYQKMEKQRTLSLLNQQRQSKEFANDYEKILKEKQIAQRLKCQQQMKMKNKKKIAEKIRNQHDYREVLEQMVQEKQVRNSLDGGRMEKPLRHNPITNPIQYHIDNPYFLKKMQERQHQYSG